MLEKVIANGGEVTTKGKRKSMAEFPLELLNQFKYREDKSINKLLSQLYEPITDQNIRKIPGVSINNWLISCGYLVEAFDDRTQKNAKFPTEKGQQIGLRSEYLIAHMTGKEYVAVIYNKTAQEFLINNFEKFLNGEVIE